MFATRMVGLPGSHGAGVAGTQGIGVRIPSAAEVAAATVGLAGEEHIPNGIMLTMGVLSRMLAAGMVPARIVGRMTISEQGATPKLQVAIAPMQTCIPTAGLLSGEVDVVLRQSDGWAVFLGLVPPRHASPSMTFIFT